MIQDEFKSGGTQLHYPFWVTPYSTLLNLVKCE